jgi:hypothetical protein
MAAAGAGWQDEHNIVLGGDGRAADEDTRVLCERDAARHTSDAGYA